MYDISGGYDIGANQLLLGADPVDLLLSGLMDDDDISGDDDDIIGAAVRGRRGGKSMALAKKRAIIQAVAQRRVNQGGMVQEHKFTKSRNWPLPFDTVTTVAAGATVNVTSNPQMPFKPYRLIIAGSIASSFLLNNIIIGQQPQFAALNAAGPADAFAPGAFQVDLDCDTAQPNTNVILQVTNSSLAALRFNAFLIGKSIL